MNSCARPRSGSTLITTIRPRLARASCRIKDRAMRISRVLSALDYHTEGEPMRIVNGGGPPPPGRPPLERSTHFAPHHDSPRRLVLPEPPGPPPPCAAPLVPPRIPHPPARAGFFEPLGVVRTCG